ncbi:MAG: hypothetical protein KGI60_00425 [Patescibacteria group bacterium]|nr:hypothetical protein [Patescibacteria group bacterium]
MENTVLTKPEKSFVRLLRDGTARQYLRWQRISPTHIQVHIDDVSVSMDRVGEMPTLSVGLENTARHDVRDMSLQKALFWIHFWSTVDSTSAFWYPDAFPLQKPRRWQRARGRFLARLTSAAQRLF